VRLSVWTRSRVALTALLLSRFALANYFQPTH
jgi:hypothetical protein